MWAFTGTGVHKPFSATDTLVAVLERDTLGIREVRLFNAVVRWSEAECHRQQLQVTPENKRKVLGKALGLIRFPLMTIEEFAAGNRLARLLLSHPPCHQAVTWGPCLGPWGFHVLGSCPINHLGFSFGLGSGGQSVTWHAEPGAASREGPSEVGSASPACPAEGH